MDVPKLGVTADTQRKRVASRVVNSSLKTIARQLSGRGSPILIVERPESGIEPEIRSVTPDTSARLPPATGGAAALGLAGPQDDHSNFSHVWSPKKWLMGSATACC